MVLLLKFDEFKCHVTVQSRLRSYMAVGLALRVPVAVSWLLMLCRTVVHGCGDDHGRHPKCVTQRVFIAFSQWSLQFCMLLTLLLKLVSGSV